MGYVKPPYYLSAYSLAVKAGFKGTLEQWLASLQGRNVELRYTDHQVVWRYVMPEGEPEDEWKVLFSSDEVRDQMVQETLNEAQGYAEAAAESVSRAADCVRQAQEHEKDAYNEANEARTYAERAAAAVAAVPKVLPNPQKLVLTGAVEAEYDGSENVEVSIPAGSGVHVGADIPMNGEKFWYNPDEEPEGGGTVSPEAIKQAVGEYMAENPVKETDPTVPDWAKQPNKPKYTAAEVGALPANTVIPEGGIPISSSAQVGQTIVVKAVGEDGKPTEWEAADLPSGGGGVEWKLIGEIITAEEVSDVSIVNDKPLNEMLVYYSIPPIPEDTGGTTYIMPKIIKNGVISNVFNVCCGVTKPNTKTERGRWHITALGGTIQQWSASVASPPNVFNGFREEGMLDILDAHKAGGGLIGFCIKWNLDNKFPAGIKLEVWGR